MQQQQLKVFLTGMAEVRRIGGKKENKEEGKTWRKEGKLKEAINLEVITEVLPPFK